MKDRIVHKNFADNETIDGAMISVALDETSNFLARIFIFAKMRIKKMLKLDLIYFEIE